MVRSEGNRGFRRYVPLATKKAAAARTKGRPWDPVEALGRRRRIARTPWGEAWCWHIESFHDFENRLLRGRTYVRNGSVVDLRIRKGCIEGRVAGARIYKQRVTIAPCKPSTWKRIVAQGAGKIATVIELLEGRFSHAVMDDITTENDGLLPDLGLVELQCSCPDWAYLCKRLAALLYGVGVRLDEHPELLFELRGVDPLDLVVEAAAGPATDASQPAAARVVDGDLSDLFGIDLDTSEETPPREPSGKKAPVKKGGKTKTSRKKVDASVSAGLVALAPCRLF